MESEERKATLFDFLYIDFDRVNSLYSQLFSGLLSVIEQVASETITSGTDLRLGPSSFGTTRRSEQKESESRVDRLNPHDLILSDVLQGLVQNNFIQTDVSQAHPGNLVLLNGRISILNFEAYRHIINIIPNFPMPTVGGMTHTEKKHRKQQEKEERKVHEFTSNIIKLISELVPWGLQIIMQTSSLTAWGALRTENLRELPGNITLKMGPTLTGNWYLLGIVDVVGPPEQELPANLTPQIQGMIDAANTIRSMFGRPDNHLGVTPLLIFRKLSSQT